MKSFEEILREKMTEKESNSHNERHAFSHTAPRETAWNLYEIPRFSFNQPNAKSYRLKNENPKSQPEVLWTPENLPEEIAAAYRFFHQHGENKLTDNSSPMALKRAFRRLARDLHPDRFATHGELVQKQKAVLFRELRHQYEIILDFIEQKAHAA